MKKILASLLAITMLLTTMSASLIPVSADNTSVATAEIFTEDFEDYEKDKNWLNNITDSYVTGVVPDENEGDWFIYDGTSGANTSNIYQGAAGAEIMVVDAEKAGLGTGRGQVLKIYGGAGTDAHLTLKRTLDNTDGKMGTLADYGSATKHYGPTKYISASNLLKVSAGKKLVYEVKYYAPSAFYTPESHLMTMTASPYQKANSTAAGSIYTALATNKAYLRTMGTTSGSHYARAMHNENRDDEWHTIKVVADFSAAANKDYWHTSRLYLDDKLVTARYTKDPASGSYLEGSAAYTPANKTNNIDGDEVYDFAPYQRVPTSSTETDTDSKMKVGETHGWFFAAQNDKDGTGRDGNALYYIDDFNAYWVDALAMGTAVNTENYKTGAIEIPFNSEIQSSVTKYDPELITQTDLTKYPNGYSDYTRFKSTSTTTKTITEVENADNALITIVDESGNLVEGGVASVALTNGGKTVSVTPDMEKLAGNTTYKIAIDPMFCDVYGQALTATTAATPVTNYVEFNTAASEFVAEVDKASISATEGDENITATVTLSEVVTDEDIEDAFTVTNTATSEEVTTGWSATLSDDGTEVTLDFADLAAGSYELTMNDITASGVNKELTNAEEIVISISIAEKLVTDDLFNETFEDYEKGVNWLNNITDNFVTSTNTGVKDNDWYISSSYMGVDGAEIMVVDAEEEGLGTDKGQVLKINGGNSSTASVMLSLQKTVNNIEGIEATDNRITYNNLIKAADGRKLVYEVEYYTIDGFYTGEAHFMANAGKLAPGQYAAGDGSFYTAFSANYQHIFRKTGNSDYTYYSKTNQNFDDRGSWHTMKIVVDYTGKSGEAYWNTSRLYLDDKLVTAKYTKKNTTDTYVIKDKAPYEIGDEIYDFFTDSLPTASRAYPKTGDMYGWVFSAKNGTSKAEYNGKAVYYINNFKAYWVDTLEMDAAVNAENYVSGVIEIPFNSEIKESVTKYNPTTSTVSKYTTADVTTKTITELNDAEKALVKIVDEKGNHIEDGIKSISLSDNNRSLLITPNMDALWGGRTYQIALDPLFSDIFGQAFTSETTSLPVTTYITFTTAKNNSLSIESATSADLSTAGKVSTSINLVNVADASKTAFMAVAVYNAQYEMIGIKALDVTVGAKGTSSEQITVDIGDHAASDVAYVKAHLWNSFDDMNPYQAAESIGL